MSRWKFSRRPDYKTKSGFYEVTSKKKKEAGTYESLSLLLSAAAPAPLSVYARETTRAHRISKKPFTCDSMRNSEEASCKYPTQARHRPQPPDST